MGEPFELILGGIHGIKGRMKKIEKSLFANEMMADIGMYALNAIKKRTLKGEDVNGSDFSPYSPKYALFRKKEGYQVDHVDLNWTGGMLASMTYETSKEGVHLFFMNTSDTRNSRVRNPEKAFYLNQDREFFALSSDDVNKIKDIVKDYYAKLMKVGE